MQYDRVDILNAAIKHYGRDSQIDMMIEEMSELIKALLKYRRSGYHQTLLCEIREEMADVRIMLDQMKILFGATDGEEARKIRRLSERLKMGVGNNGC